MLLGNHAEKGLLIYVYSQNPEDTATVSPLIAMHCFSLSITFRLIYNNTCMWFGQNFILKILRRPSNPAKILDLPEVYKTGCQFFIFLYFVYFFLYYYKQTVLHLTSPSFLSTSCFTAIHQLFLNRKKCELFYKTKCATQTHFTIVVMVFTRFVGQLPAV